MARPRTCYNPTPAAEDELARCALEVSTNSSSILSPISTASRTYTSVSALGLLGMYINVSL